MDLASVSLSAGEFGALVGVSERRVRELRDQTVLASDARGRYPMAENVLRYCGHLRPASGRSAGGGSAQAASLDDARIRLTTAQAEARELLNQQLRGEAVLAEDLAAIVGVTFDSVRAKMLAIPVAAAARVVGLASKTEIQAKLAGMVNDALADMAGAEVIGSVKDRARRRAGRSSGDDDDGDAAE